MDKQQKLKIALPILLIIMAFVWGPVITGGGQRKAEDINRRGKARRAPTVAVNGNNLLSLAHANERNKARTSFSDWGRNPFTLGENSRASVLEGILWDTQNPKAIINGDILGIGDRLGAGEIIDIRQDAVTIKTGDIEKEFRLGL